MRLLQTILISALSLSPIPVLAADPPATAPAAPPVASQVAPAPLDSIQKAATPSEAVAAYARAAASDPNNVQLEQAYVRKMVDFGMPELADAQAHDLINRNAADGLAIGVAAYMYAARGDYGAAVQQLKIALMQSPDDAFLLRTAGQMVAWYDAQPDHSTLTATDVACLEWIRSSENGKPTYVDAYKSWAQAPIGQGNPATQPVAPTGDARIVYPPVDYSAVPQNAYVSNNYYYDSGYYTGGYWAYPIYTNPFNCVVGTPWRHRHFNSFGPGFHGGVFVGTGHDHDFGRFHTRDFHGNDRGFTPFQSVGVDSSRGNRGGRDGGAVRSSPTFRGGMPSPSPSLPRTLDRPSAPSSPPMQTWRQQTSPAPRDPGPSRSSGSNSTGNSGGNDGGGRSHR